ncbi:MAG: transcriptional repressor [gamma proteobacterium symbiont of Ctena orbiculata]|nr:MAG: transcriptional repressor [gamma proteobacterium symbiont of Ctena orbiculata]
MHNWPPREVRGKEKPVNYNALSHVLERAEALCHARGVQLTEQRKTVLQLLCVSDKPLSAYELLEHMRGVVKNPAPSTVYRALDFLLEQGLAHKLESLHAYVGCAHPDHPHDSQFLICDDCGEVAEVEDPSVAKSLKAAGKAIGFRTKRPVVELLGTCAQCVAKRDE